MRMLSTLPVEKDDRSFFTINHFVTRTRKQKQRLLLSLVLTLKLLAFDKIKCALASLSKYSVVISQRERE